VPRGQYEFTSQNHKIKPHFGFDLLHSRRHCSMSWRAQNRSQDAKKQITHGTRSGCLVLLTCGIQRYPNMPYKTSDTPPRHKLVEMSRRTPAGPSSLSTEPNLTVVGAPIAYWLFHQTCRAQSLYFLVRRRHLTGFQLNASL
jgi:hypothetical protein